MNLWIVLSSAMYRFGLIHSRIFGRKIFALVGYEKCKNADLVDPCLDNMRRPHNSQQPLIKKNIVENLDKFMALNFKRCNWRPKMKTLKVRSNTLAFSSPLKDCKVKFSEWKSQRSLRAQSWLLSLSNKSLFGVAFKKTKKLFKISRPPCLKFVCIQLSFTHHCTSK